MARQYISPPEVGPTHGLYNKGVHVGNVIYVASQVAWDRDDNVVGLGDPAAQAEQLISNMGRVLEAAGASFVDVVNTTT